jgi:hypothetical protein
LDSSERSTETTREAPRAATKASEPLTTTEAAPRRVTGSETPPRSTSPPVGSDASRIARESESSHATAMRLAPEGEAYAHTLEHPRRSQSLTVAITRGFEGVVTSTPTTPSPTTYAMSSCASIARASIWSSGATRSVITVKSANAEGRSASATSASEAKDTRIENTRAEGAREARTEERKSARKPERARRRSGGRAVQMRRGLEGWVLECRGRPLLISSS